MKRLLLILSLLSAAVAASAQADRMEQKYDLLVSQLGPAGVGVETVLNNWEKADSTNAKMLMGRFNYYFTKAQSSEVVTRPTKKYLGMDPILTLKDTTGADVHYYQVNVFDDELYGEAVKAADKAMRTWPDRIDFRFMKANAYIAYEKESPDMALAYLQNLVKENSTGKAWEYDGAEVDEYFFEDAMQEYCFSFYSIGSPASHEAFRTLSEQLYALFPDNTGFLNNIGSYYLIKQEYKTALKQYDKVLKKQKDDYIAIQNAMLASRRLKNVKLEKKYLAMMVKYGPEKDSKLAETRLAALNAK